MKTLGEIITEALDGETPSHEECYWAMLTLRNLVYFSNNDLMRLASKHDNGHPFGPVFRYGEASRRYQLALEKSPKEWMGANNDPSNPVYQKRRKAALRFFDDFMNKQEGENQE